MILIAPYDPRWSSMFESESSLLRGPLSAWLDGELEHIGSTAVPGLAAKPVIDIMAPVRTLVDCAPAIELLTQYGYCYYPYKPEVMHWFCKPSPEVRTHHLHLVPRQSKLWRDRLAFRDALRASPVRAAEYEQLKRKLARQHPNDREAYTDGKSEFVNRVLAMQRADH